MLHYKACANTRRKKLADIAMIVFGLAAAAYTTIQTVKVSVLSLASFLYEPHVICQLMIEPDTSGPPKFGNCDPPQ